MPYICIMNLLSVIRRKRLMRLHWRLFFPLVAMLWIIIAIVISYFVTYEKQRQKENLENRLINVNNTVIEAYERGVDLDKTVDFVKLITDNTTLAPLRITVYDRNGMMIADNPARTIKLQGESSDEPDLNLLEMADDAGVMIRDIVYGSERSMICSRVSSDGLIYSFAALPYSVEVIDYIGVGPMVWVLVIALGLLSSFLAYLGVVTVSRNVYALRDFAHSIASDAIPSNIDFSHFSNDELGDVSRNLLTLYREKIDAKQEKIRHEQQIALNVSHELNTPISIIKGYIDTLLADDGMPTEVRRDFMLRAKQNADRLASLVRDVSMVMRLNDTDSKRLSAVPVNIRDLVSQIAGDVVWGNTIGDMSFNFDIPADCVVAGHESLLTNVMLNLIRNAAKYSGGSEISFRWLRLENGRHIFQFSDNGVGVPSEHIEHLFELFYRVDVGRSRKNGGTGLGLPIVKRIITSLGGDIQVDNAPSGGLRFIISIPAVIPDDNNKSNG